MLACDAPSAVGGPMHAVVARRTRSEAGEWQAFVRDGSLHLQAGDEPPVFVSDGVLPEVSFAPDGTSLVYAREERGQSDLWRLALPDGEPERLLAWPSSEDRPAHGPDGELVFVSGVTGLAALWSLDLATGATRQLTNVGLEHAPRAPGRPPRGFEPPPDAETLRWDDDGVHWVADLRAWTVVP